MSISISTYPQLYVIFARSGVKYQIKTSGAKTLGTAGSFTLVFTEFPVQDDKLKFVWGEYDLNFTFKNAPDASGLQLYSAADLLENQVYYIRLDFMKNFSVSQNWTITQGTGANTHKLYFVAKYRGDQDIAVTFPVGTHVSLADKTDGTEDTYLDNYRVLALAFLDGVQLGGPDYFPVFHEDASADGYADIDMAEYIVPAITPSPANMTVGQKIVERTDVVDSFDIQFAESYGDPATVKALLSANLHTIICIKGGVGDQMLGILNDSSKSIFQLLEGRKSFLSFMPNEMLIDLFTPVSLFYLHFTSAASIVVKIKLYFTNGNTWTGTSTTLAGCTKYKVYEINADIQALLTALNPTAGTVTGYEVWLQDTLGTALTETKRFNLDYNRTKGRYFKFLNSFGVYDVIRTTGDFSKAKRYSGQNVSKTLPFTISKSDFHMQRINIRQTESFSASTGFCNVNSPEFEQLSEMMGEMFLSEEIYEHTPNGLLPILITSSDYLVSADDDNMRAVAFEYQKTYSDKLSSGLIDGGNSPGSGGFFGDGFGLGFGIDNNGNPLITT